jgi:hypothetical protein
MANVSLYYVQKVCTDVKLMLLDDGIDQERIQERKVEEQMRAETSAATELALTALSEQTNFDLLAHNTLSKRATLAN